MIRTVALSFLCAAIGLCCARETPVAAPDRTADLADMKVDGGAGTNLLAVGGWSEPVKDAAGYSLRGRLLVFDMTCFTNTFGSGAPNIYFGNAPVYLELQNLSPRLNKGLAVYFALGDGFEFDMRDSVNKTLRPNQMVVFSGPITPFTMQSWTTVPFDGSIRLRLSPKTSISPPPKGINIQFGMGAMWTLAAGSNSCYLSGTFSPPTNHPAPPGSPHVWAGTLKLPPVKIDAPLK